MMSATVLRELGAETRTFRSVRAAIGWYASRLCSRLNAQRDHGPRAPRSQERIDEGHATFAALAKCIGRSHWSDEEITSRRMQESLPLTGERLVFLVAWYDNTYGNGEDLARQWNPRADSPRWAFVRWCKITERILRHRLEAAGLLAEPI